MKIEWDEAKNRANIRKHGLDFRDAEEISAGRFWQNRTCGTTTEKSAGEDLV